MTYTCLISAVRTWYGVLFTQIPEVLIFLVGRDDYYIVIVNIDIHTLDHHQTNKKSGTLEENNKLL